MANGLTDKQHVFVEEYLKCWNATESARRAGYDGDDNTLGVIGWENLRKPKIAEYISKRLSAVVMTSDEVLSRLSQQARADIANFMSFGEGTWKLDLDKIKEFGHLIKKIKQGRWGLEIELYDAQAAMIQIGKAHGIFSDRIDFGGVIETKGEVTHVIDSDTAATIFDILAAAGAIGANPDDSENDEVHTPQADA